MSDPSTQTALVAGAGAAGSAAALALAAAGVGRIVLVDDTAVLPADLGDGPLLADADLGRPRADAAAARLGALYPALAVEPRRRPFDAAAGALAREASLVIGALDPAAAMFAVNDAAMAAQKPFVHVGLAAFTAQLLSTLPGATGCLRCLFEFPPPPRALAQPGPLPPGPLQALAGALAGAEAVRLLEGRPGTYAGRLVSFEARSAVARAVPVRRRHDCPACGALPDTGVAPAAGDAP